MSNKDELKTSYWQSHISEQEKSSLNITEYCEKSGISRKSLSESLEREEIIIELPESERFSDDGTPLKIIGYETSEKLSYETSEKLSYEPSKTKVIVYKRAKYGVDSGDYEKTAPHPTKKLDSNFLLRLTLLGK